MTHQLPLYTAPRHPDAPSITDSDELAAIEQAIAILEQRLPVERRASEKERQAAMSVAYLEDLLAKVAAMAVKGRA